MNIPIQERVFCETLEWFNDGDCEMWLLNEVLLISWHIDIQEFIIWEQTNL